MTVLPRVGTIQAQKLYSNYDLIYKIEFSPGASTNKSHHEELKRSLENRLGGEFKIAVEGAGGRFMTVRSTPADTMEAEQPLLVALQAILKPEVPHTAVGLLLTQPSLRHMYVMGVQVLGGGYTRKDMRNLHKVINSAPGVIDSQTEPGDWRVTLLTIKGNWELSPSNGVLRELISRGVHVTLGIPSIHR